jgi:hypothetical protein
MSAEPIERLIGDTLALLTPPPSLSLPDWAEKEFRLPERSSAQPGFGFGNISADGLTQSAIL